MHDAGRSIREILAAGEWCAPAYFKYQDVDQYEHDIILSAHLGDSDGDDP